MTLVATATTVLVLTERNVSMTSLEELARSPRYRLVGRVESLRAAVEATRVHRPDVVIVDLWTTERLRELEAGALTAIRGRVVVVSSLPAEAALLVVMGAGARAFVGKPFEPDLLHRALSAVTGGHCFVDPRSTTWLMHVALHGHRSRPLDGLTLRQSQVVELVRGGLTNREIARALGVSLATVKSHLHQAMRRLGVTDRWAATVLAERLRDADPGA